MNAEEFYKSLFTEGAHDYPNVRDMITFAEAYHEHKMKELNIKPA